MREKLVIIGANDFQNQLILKAKELGYETHVFAWRCGDIGESSADFFYPISIIEKEEILEKCKEIKPVGILSIASDLASVTVNYVAEKLGLIGNGIYSSLVSTNKYLMRKKFQEYNLPSPKYVKVSEIQECEKEIINYPIIVKPTDRSGSRGIYKVEYPNKLEKAISLAKQQSFEKEVLLEEFVEGEEFSVEYISYQGKHHFLAITKKYTTGAPNFIETGHLQPVEIEKNVLERVKKIVEKGLDCLGIKNGASHSEIKINDNSIKIIEIGGRMGGDCIGSDLVKLSTGYDFMKMVIDVACGKRINLLRTGTAQSVLIRFLFTSKDFEILKKIESYDTNLIYRKHIEKCNQENGIHDSSERLGYYIISTHEKEKFRKVLEYLQWEVKK